MSVFVADYDYQATAEGELSFVAGDTIYITTTQDGWYYGEHKKSGQSGWVVPTYGHTRQESPYSNLSDTMKAAKKKEAFQRLIGVQHEFHTALSAFIDGVIIPLNLRDTPFKRSFLGDSAVAVSFSLMQELQKDCSNFERVVANVTGDMELANAYIQFAPSLQIFAQYAAENAKLLNAVKTNIRQLAPLIPPEVKLEGTLVLPMQFYSTYKSEFQEYIWLTPTTSPHISPLEAALDVLIAQTDYVDMKLKEEEESYELLNLQAKFSGNPTIFTPNRRIIKEGEMERLRISATGDLDGKTYYAHLFNDALIYSQRNVMGYFKLRHTIPLKGATLEPMHNVGGPGGMTITTADEPDKPYQFRFLRDSDAADWLKAVQMQLEALKVRKKEKRMSNFAISKTNLNLPGVELARLGNRCAIIYKFLLGELQFSEAMSAMNVTLIQPLIDASKGAALTAVKVSAFSPDGEHVPASKEEMAQIQVSAPTKHQAQQITDVLKDADVKIYLRAAEGIAAATKEFATTLETVCTAGEWKEDIAIGSFFNSVSALSLYNQFQSYCDGQQAMLRILRTPLLAPFYRDAESFLADFPGSLADKIELPRKRVKHYFYFLSELQKFTPAEHSDHTAVGTSKEALDFMDKKIEELIRVKRNFEVLLEIQSSFVMGSDPILSKLASMDRTFIKQGDLKKVCRRKPKQFRFWLFNDYLLYGSALGGGNFSFNRALDLRKCTVKPHTGVDIKNAFEIFGAEKSFVVIASSLTMQKEWVEAIQRTRNELLASQGVSTEDADSQLDTAPLWVPDSGSDVCSLCQKGFTMFNRRHHCRKCGILVCGEHSKNKEVLPNVHKTQKQRICDNCFNNRGNAAVTPKSRSASEAPAATATAEVSSPSKPRTASLCSPPAPTSPAPKSPTSATARTSTAAAVPSTFSSSVEDRIRKNTAGGTPAEPLARTALSVQKPPSSAPPPVPARSPTAASPAAPTSAPPKAPRSASPLPGKLATAGGASWVKKDDPADGATTGQPAQRPMRRRTRVAPPPPSNGAPGSAAAAASSLLAISESGSPPPLPSSPPPSAAPPPVPSSLSPPIPGAAAPAGPTSAPPKVPRAVPPPVPKSPPPIPQTLPPPIPQTLPPPTPIPATATASPPLQQEPEKRPSMSRAPRVAPPPPPNKPPAVPPAMPPPIPTSLPPPKPSPASAPQAPPAPPAAAPVAAVAAPPAAAPPLAGSPPPQPPRGSTPPPPPPPPKAPTTKGASPPPPPPPPPPPATATAPAPAAAATEEADDEHFRKFRKMKEMLPEGAVRQKMLAEGYAPTDIDSFLAGKVSTLPLPSSSGAGAAATPANPLAGLGSVQLRPAGSGSGSAGGSAASPKPLSLLEQIQAGPKLKAVQADDTRMKAPNPAGSLQGQGGLLGMLAVEMSKRRFNMKVQDEDSDSDSSGFSDTDSDSD